jgi:hypothetical protein
MMEGNFPLVCSRCFPYKILYPFFLLLYVSLCVFLSYLHIGGLFCIEIRTWEKEIRADYARQEEEKSD